MMVYHFLPMPTISSSLILEAAFLPFWLISLIVLLTCGSAGTECVQVRKGLCKRAGMDAWASDGTAADTCRLTPVPPPYLVQPHKTRLCIHTSSCLWRHLHLLLLPLLLALVVPTHHQSPITSFPSYSCSPS